jgi:CubicO group peptidase (beta-lactamase class C family)
VNYDNTQVSRYILFKRNKMFLRTTYLLLFVSVLCTACRSQINRVDSLMSAELIKEHIPGFAACTIEKGKIVWSGYYGYQDVERKIPVTKGTLFMIASVSKTITAAALMQLYAKGKFRLDDDINKYLDFKVVNPTYPTIPVTFRQLLRHRSSIADNHEYLGQFWNVNKGDPTIPLSAFLKNYLSVTGANFNKEKNFYGYPPGSYQVYSNIGFALIGYLVERIAGEPFDQFCKKRIFEPLSMNNTAWFLRDLDSNQVARPYYYSDSLHQFVSYGFGGYPDFPAGQLRTSADQLASFLIGWTQNGKWSGKQVMDSATIQLMTPDFVDLGFYTWILYPMENGKILYSHPGGDNGALSYIMFDPSTKKGLVLLANGRIKAGEIRKIINLLFNRTP